MISLVYVGVIVLFDTKLESRKYTAFTFIGDFIRAGAH